MNQDAVTVMKLEDKNYYMNEALKEAIKSYKKGETPIGAVIVYDGKIIARAHNLRETKNNSLYHAEVLAIEKACKKIGSWRLEECDLYVTLEPCVMCAGAMIQSRIRKCYYGAKNDRFGVHQGPINLFDVNFNHKVNIEGGILSEQCSKIISDFFKELRSK